MDLIRKLFDNSYTLAKPFLFYATRKDNEVAHDLFILFCQTLDYLELDELVLDNDTNRSFPNFKISNAAGFNKNGKISSRVMKYLGFDRNVSGTLTGEKWLGNERPRTKRFDNSLTNNIGWENDGAEKISQRVYDNYELPITINFGFTPKPDLTIEQILGDLKKTIGYFRDILCVDRFEYNPSCPNLCISREENQRLLEIISRFIRREIYPEQNLYIKVSPDLNDQEIDEFIRSTFDFADGYTTTNTTTKHSYGKGGASGDILYPLALEIQKKFYEILKGTDKKIIACGGINSLERVKERIEFEPQEEKEIQIFTPLIFKGPGLLRKLRKTK